MMSCFLDNSVPIPAQSSPGWMERWKEWIGRLISEAQLLRDALIVTPHIAALTSDQTLCVFRTGGVQNRKSCPGRFYWSCPELAAATHLISAIYQRLFALPLLLTDKLSPPFISLSLFLFDSIVLSVIFSLAHSLSALTKGVALTADKAMVNIVTSENHTCK